MNAAALPWLTSLLVFFAFPLAGLVVLSLTDQAGNFSIANYASLADLSSGRLDVLIRTLRIGVMVILISLCISVPVAYYLAKIVKSTRVESLILLLVTATFLAGPLVRTVSWRGILGVHGLINEPLMQLGLIQGPILSLLYGELAMTLALVYNVFPFLLFTTYLSMKVLDDRIIAAARDLGASPASAFFRVVLPLASPGVITGAVLVFVPTLSAVLEPEILGGTSSRLMATAIRDQFFHARNWPLGAALTVVLIISGAITLTLVALVTSSILRFFGHYGLATGGTLRGK
ncbi:ABC transporter permease [Aestuariivirga sp.]|uniref:ABC transporter permease n=1 Tax=Aestuariivirga sp. TaxID=2650926 RepID=UPI00391945EA